MVTFLKRFHRVIYPLLIVVFLLILEKGFNIQSWHKFVIAIGAAYALSPRKKIIQTQTGEKTQLTWLFLKEPIFLD